MERAGARRPLEDRLLMTPLPARKRRRCLDTELPGQSLGRGEEGEPTLMEIGGEGQESSEGEVSDSLEEEDCEDGEEEDDDIEGDIEEGEIVDYSAGDEESSEDSSEASEEEIEWTTEQLELLETALPSFRFLPRTCLDKVTQELRQAGGEGGRVKARARLWLERRLPAQADLAWAGDRLALRRAKLQEVGSPAAGSQEPRPAGSRVKFAEELVDVRMFESEDN